MSHALERTNPKGQPFVGRCMKCGKEELTISDIDKFCPANDRMSDEEAVLAALRKPSMSYYDDIVQLHLNLDLPVAHKPVVPSHDRIRLRRSLLVEECRELDDALFDCDRGRFPTAEAIARVAHEAADLIVVTLGTCAEFGIPFESVWDEVQLANMAKAGGPKRADGKQLKPEGWPPPDILSIIKEYV